MRARTHARIQARARAHRPQCPFVCGSGTVYDPAPMTSHKARLVFEEALSSRKAFTGEGPGPGEKKQTNTTQKPKRNGKAPPSQRGRNSRARRPPPPGKPVPQLIYRKLQNKPDSSTINDRAKPEWRSHRESCYPRGRRVSHRWVASSNSIPRRDPYSSSSSSSSSLLPDTR